MTMKVKPPRLNVELPKLGTERIIAVSDAGPLIHLSEIDLLSTLEVFESIHIPEAVCCEVANHRVCSQHATKFFFISKRKTLIEVKA
jgi:predicted nucleic acid-binding protein